MNIFSQIGKAAMLALVSCLMLSTIPEAEARKQVIRLTTLAPKDSSFHKLLLRMGQEWKRATNGKVNLIVFAGGIQGGETAMIDRMRINQTQAALVTGIGLAEIDEAVGGIQKIPLLFRSLDELDYVMKGIAPDLEKRLSDKAFVTLAWIDTGWVHIFSKKPLETPEDMRKVKLFTQTGDPQQTDLLKGLGFKPIPIESTDIMPSLQTGLIDTVPLPPFFALASQSYKPAPHMLDLNYVPLVGAMVVSEKVWSRIAPEHQEAMMRIARRIGAEMTVSGRQENVDSIRVMKEKWGLNVREMDDQLFGAWESVATNAYPIIRDKTVPAEIFDKVMQLIGESRSN